MVDKVEFSFPDETDDDDKKSTVKEETPEIEIVDDTPEKDKGRKPLDKEVNDPTDDELSEYSDKVKARINELTHVRHDERRKREAAEREKQEALRYAEAAAQENSKLKKQLHNGSTNYATQSQQLAEIKLKDAKARMKQAHEAGDSDALVEAQQEVSTAVLELERVKSFRPTPLQSDDGTGNVASDTPQRPPVAKVDEKVTTWRAKNPWYGEDEEMTAFALGVHRKLVNAGYDTKSDAYYNAIDMRMKAVFPDQFKSESTEKSSSDSAKKPATVVASVSRASSPTKIVLTKTQVAIAKRLGVPLEIYARKVAELNKSEQ